MNLSTGDQIAKNVCRTAALAVGLGLGWNSGDLWAASAGAANDPAAKPDQPYALDLVVVSANGVEAGSSLSQSVTTLSADTIQNARLFSPRDFSTLAPNLAVFDANGDRVPRFSIRGLRENNFSSQYGASPAVSMYVDDVPYNDLNSRGIPLYDIDQIEMFRGPQGTLFGASRPGGVINILTKLPGQDWHGHGKISYGNYDHQTYSAGVSGPVVANHLFLGVSGFYGRRDGFFHNPFLDTHPDTRDTLSGRLQLRWMQGDRWEFTFTESAERFDDGFVAIVPIDQPGDRFQAARDYDGFANTDSHTESFRAACTLANVKLISITTHREWKQDLVQDFDFMPVDLVRGFTHPDVRQWSQEVRLQSPDDAGKFKWVAGGYFSDQAFENSSGSRYSGLPTPAGFIPGPFTDRTTGQLEDRNYALFGQATYTLFETVDLTAGLRCEYDERNLRRQRADQIGALFGAPPIPDIQRNDDFTSAQPKFGIAYHCSPEVTTYFNAAAGYQSGGFNLSNNDPRQAAFDAAESWHYELGNRSFWFDHRLVADVNLFYTDTRDYQVYRPITSTDFYMVNAEQATSMGAEFELRARPVEGWEFSAGFGYVHARFDRFTDPANGANFDGKTINFVPEYTVNLAAQYRAQCGLFARVELQGMGDFYYDEANTRQQKSYALFNARAGWENEHFGVYFFGRNLLDREYFANAINFRQPNAIGGFDDFFVGTPGDPLTFGVEVRARF